MDERSPNRWQHRLNREHPTCTGRIKLAHRECGWKGGDSGDSAAEKPCPTKNKIKSLDSDRPSHGRRLHSEPHLRVHECYCDTKRDKRILSDEGGKEYPPPSRLVPLEPEADEVGLSGLALNDWEIIHYGFRSEAVISQSGTAPISWHLLPRTDNHDTLP